MVCYTKVTDEIFHRILYNEDPHPEMVLAQTILGRVLNRKLYNYIGFAAYTEGDERSLDFNLNNKVCFNLFIVVGLYVVVLLMQN